MLLKLTCVEHSQEPRRSPAADLVALAAFDCRTMGAGSNVPFGVKAVSFHKTHSVLLVQCKVAQGAVHKAFLPVRQKVVHP